MAKPTVSGRFGSLGSGALTGAALAVQTGLAAVVGIVLAREFGRGAETDGFFAAYGVFIVIVLAAGAIRVTVLPTFARARASGCLGGEAVSFVLALAVIALPVLILGTVLRGPVATLLTGGAPVAQATAAMVLPWMLLAATCQLFAGLAASVLAAMNDYASPAVGFALGSVLGLAYILWRVNADGVSAFSIGMTVNGVVALGVPAVAIAIRAARDGSPRSALRPRGGSAFARLSMLGFGVALPFALQALYVMLLPFASRDGEGEVTSLAYAYLVSSAVVAVCASSLGLVTAVPLARSGLGPGRAVRHIVASSWLALVAIGVAAAVFGVAGGNVVGSLLGPDYNDRVGRDLGLLVVALTPWMVVAVTSAVTFPLLFVAGAIRKLPLTALAVVIVQVPLAWTGNVLFGVTGLALALAASTGLAVLAMLAMLEAVRATVVGVGVAAIKVAVVALVAFIPVSLVLSSVPAAVVGTIAYAVIVAVLRPPQLVDSWHYMRGLG